MSKQVTKPSKHLGPGAALRAIRLQNGWTLADVHARTGISVSTLSKLETGQLDPNFTQLMVRCERLGLDIAQLIGGEPAIAPHDSEGAVFAMDAPLRGRRVITRRGEETELSDNIYNYKLHAAELLHRNLHPMVLTVKARSLEEFGDFMRHSGEEFTYVLQGEVDFCSDVYAPVRMRAGDSIYFDAEMGHAWLAASDEPCVILAVFEKSRDA